MRDAGKCSLATELIAARNIKSGLTHWTRGKRIIGRTSSSVCYQCLLCSNSVCEGEGMCGRGVSVCGCGWVWVHVRGVFEVRVCFKIRKGLGHSLTQRMWSLVNKTHTQIHTHTCAYTCTLRHSKPLRGEINELKNWKQRAMETLCLILAASAPEHTGSKLHVWFLPVWSRICVSVLCVCVCEYIPPFGKVGNGWKAKWETLSQFLSVLFLHALIMLN